MYNVRILSPSLLAKLQYHMGFIVFTSFLPVRDPGEELRIVFTVVSLIIRPQWRWFGSSLHSQSSIYFDDLCGAKKNFFFFLHHSEAHTRSQRKSNINHECENQDARWLNRGEKGHPRREPKSILIECCRSARANLQTKLNQREPNTKRGRRIEASTTST